MKRLRWVQGIAVALACLGLMIPHHALAAGLPAASPAAEPAIQDVALAPGGVLAGQVVDLAGAPRVGVEVVIGRQGERLLSLTTNEDGRFAAGQLRGGVYQLSAGGGEAIYRAWAIDTAPPAAQRDVLLVASGDDLFRGQGPVAYWLSNPWVIGGIVATAIAVPVILSKNKKSKS